MTSFAFLPNSNLGVESDLRREGTAYVKRPALEAAVRISLFTNARAQPGDELPEGNGDFGEDINGYWAEPFLSDSGPYGSRLWTLSRSTLTRETRQKARDFSLEALGWMVALGIARKVDVDTSVIGPGCLLITVLIYRAAGGPAERFSYLWEEFA